MKSSRGRASATRIFERMTKPQPLVKNRRDGPTHSASPTWLAFCALAVLGVAMPSRAAQGTIEALKVRVESEKACYLEHEPVQVIVTVESDSGQEIKGVSNPLAAGLSVELAAPGKAFEVYSPPWMPGCALAPKPLSNFIPHGFKGSRRLTVYADTLRKDKVATRIFPESGEYRCRVRLAYSGVEVVSNSIEIVVGKPSTPVDVVAAEFIRKNDLDVFLWTDAPFYSPSNTALAKAEEAVGRFPKSSYEPYLCLGLSAVYMTRSTPGGNPANAFDKAGLHKALDWGSGAAGAMGHPVNSEGSYLAGKASYLLRYTKKAKGYLTQALACEFESNKGECNRLLDSLKTFEAAEIDKDK